MACRHWRQEDFFCVKKQETINPDELADCAETCSNYEPRRKREIVICNNCGAKFPLKGTTKIGIKTEEYPRCPSCGIVVGVWRDDEKLSK